MNTKCQSQPTLDEQLSEGVHENGRGAHNSLSMGMRVLHDIGHHGGGI